MIYFDNAEKNISLTKSLRKKDVRFLEILTSKQLLNAIVQKYLSMSCKLLVINMTSGFLPLLLSQKAKVLSSIFIQTQTYLQVFVQDASHRRKEAIISLMSDEPGLCYTKLFGVNKDESLRLSKGLQHKCCQPKGKTNESGGVDKKWKGIFMCWETHENRYFATLHRTSETSPSKNHGGNYSTCHTLPVCNQRTGMYGWFNEIEKGRRRGADGCGTVWSVQQDAAAVL